MDRNRVPADRGVDPHESSAGEPSTAVPSDPRALLAMLREATAGDINMLLARIDVGRLFHHLPDHGRAPDDRTSLVDLLGRDRLHDLTVTSRAILVGALQRERAGDAIARIVRDVLLSLQGAALTAFKNALDALGSQHDLLHLVFHDVDDTALRAEILEHFAREAARAPSGEVKVLSDIDDTFYSNWKDARVPDGAAYPGVVQFYRELDRGPGTAPGREGDLTFVSARPEGFASLVHDRTLRMLQGHGIRTATLLLGSITHLFGAGRMAAGKLENFERYRLLYPEYGFVFVGDDGQGDVLFGQEILRRHAEAVRAVFIHDVVDMTLADREAFRRERVFVFDTYVGAAVDAFAVGLVERAAVSRVAERALDELGSVPFSDASQRAWYRAALERDLARTHAGP